MKKLLCIKCQKEVANIDGKINGITTWFSVCSECMYNTEGWKNQAIICPNCNKKIMKLDTNDNSEKYLCKNCKEFFEVVRE